MSCSTPSLRVSRCVAWKHVSHCTRDTWQGYYNALERTFFMDHVDDASLKYWEVNCAVHRRGLELIR